MLWIKLELPPKMLDVIAFRWHIADSLVLHHSMRKSLVSIIVLQVVLIVQGINFLYQLQYTHFVVVFQ